LINQYVKLVNIIIFIVYREYDAQEHTAQEVKDEVELHLKEREILEDTLPSSVLIGPFWVTMHECGYNLNIFSRHSMISTKYNTYIISLFPEFPGQ
jgi:predicted secreted protein